MQKTGRLESGQTHKPSKIGDFIFKLPDPWRQAGRIPHVRAVMLKG
jgi:hypothetical protein